MIHIEHGRAASITIPPLFKKVMPDQGSVELQRDAAGKEHAWHTHAVDETIIVLEGGLRFYWDDGDRHCGPGDVIHLPAETRHGSVALDFGATYLIAMRDITF